MDSENGIPATMLVGPTGYGNQGGFGGFGGDWGWIILLLLCAGGGWGNGFGGGFGGGLGYDFPWLLNGQNGINNNVSDGFRDAQLHDSVTSVRDGVSNLATQLCGCCGDYRDGSYRGRGRNARRDSMGRYASEGRRYSRDGKDFSSKLEELMDEAPDEQTRKNIQRMMNDLG